MILLSDANVSDKTNTKSIFRYKKANEVLATLTDYTLTHTNKLNDFTEGSAIETLYEAIATEIEMYYYLNMENIKFGVWNSIHDAFGFNRKPALKAYGTVLLSYNSPVSHATIIPRGATFSSSNELYSQTYETLEEVTIPAGTQYASITVYCTQAGEYGNIPSGVLDTSGNLGDVYGITNPEAFSTGQDAETLAEVRVRFRQYIQALQRGTVQALQYGANNMPNIKGSYIAEQPGLVRLYAHDANGDLPLYLQKALQGEMEYWRPAGIPVQVLPTHKTVVDLDVKITVPNSNLRVDTFLEAIRVKLIKYLNSFKVHDHLYNADIIQQVMDANDLGIVDATVDVRVYPDLALRGGLAEADDDRIYVWGNYISRSKLQPKDRSISENYIVSNPEDKDDNEYSKIDNEDQQGRTTTSTTSYLTTTTTTKEVSHGNDLIYPEELVAHFASETTRYGRTGDPRVPGNFLPTKKNPIAIESVGLLNGYYLAVSDNTVIGMTYDTSGNLIEVAVRNTDESFSQVNLNPTNISSITYQWSVKGTEHPGDTTTTNNVPLTLGKTYQARDKGMADINVTVTDSLVTIEELDSGTVTKLIRDNKELVHTDSSGQETDFIHNDEEDTFLVKYLDLNGIHTDSSYDGSRTLTGSILTFVDDLGNTTTIHRDGDGVTTRTVITDRNGNVVSDTGDDSTTTTTTDVTTSTTYPDQTTTTTVPTTTTTTANPFVDIPTVTANDAPDTGYLPVFREYGTAANEIIRAGYITVNFN